MVWWLVRHGAFRFDSFPGNTERSGWRLCISKKCQHDRNQKQMWFSEYKLIRRLFLTILSPGQMRTRVFESWQGLSWQGSPCQSSKRISTCSHFLGELAARVSFWLMCLRLYFVHFDTVHSQELTTLFDSHWLSISFDKGLTVFFIFPYQRRGSVYLGLLAQRRLPTDTLLATVRHPIVTANH